tara:strand:- start:209 stop:706 length:498 start_codon:yes stop_codon:yes gene_type:complete
MKKFAIIDNFNRVSNVLVSETTLPGVTSVEVIRSANVSIGYGYTGSTFYPPISTNVNQTPNPELAFYKDILLNSSSSYSASIEINLPRELNGVLDSSHLISNNLALDISNFTHNNNTYQITFDLVTSSNAADYLQDDLELVWGSGSVTDSFGWEWDLTPISIQID